MQDAPEEVNIKNRKYNKIETTEINNNKAEKTIIKCQSSINYQSYL